MFIVVSTDSFKDSLSSIEVCDVLSRALRVCFGDGVEVGCFPLGDGGEGTLEAVLSATGGERIVVEVHDALGRVRHASYGLLPDGSCFVEMASASGIQGLAQSERNPLLTSSYGTGELVRAALDRGCRRLTIGIGGSATNDGGAGFVRALGARLFDVDGHELEGRGCDLGKVSRVDLSGFDSRLKSCQIVVACDVVNPLCGDFGATRVFGPQKGADAGMLVELESGMRHWCEVLTGRPAEESANVPGDGAAGGLGFALRHFCGATMSSGGRLVAELSGLPAAISRSNFVVTGEGRTDGQTLHGKLPAVVADIAREHHVPCILISGAIEGDREALSTRFDACFSTVGRICSLEDALGDASDNLYWTAINVFSTLRILR